MSLHRATVLILLAACVVRVAAARGDLWLDEIWSVQAALEAESAMSVLTAIHSDNNHHLVSLWTRLVGADQPAFVYRALPLAAGFALLGVLQGSPLLRSRGERIFGAILGGFCYLLVLYASEARGYSVAMLAGLIAFHATLRMRHDPHDHQRKIYCISVVAGLMAHATFLICYISVFCWSVLTHGWGPTLRWNRAPLLAVFAYLLLVLRPMEIAGGDGAGLSAVLLDLATYAFGSVWLALAFVLIVIWELRRSSEYSSLFLVLTCVSVLAAIPAVYLHVRYFAVAVPFGVLIAARGLGSLTRTGPAGTIAAVVLVCVYVAAQAGPIQALLKSGRGQYSQACDLMSGSSTSGKVRVASDHDFRGRTVIQHYGGDRLEYAPVGTPAEWLVLQSLDSRKAHSQVRVATGESYRFVRHFNAAPLSGMHWYVYRAEAAKNTTAVASSYTRR